MAVGTNPRACQGLVVNYDIFLCRDYYSALLRTHEGFIAPTQGKLLNYVKRVPLGVVAQITVGLVMLRLRVMLTSTERTYSRSTIRC